MFLINDDRFVLRNSETTARLERRVNNVIVFRLPPNRLAVRDCRTKRTRHQFRAVFKRDASRVDFVRSVRFRRANLPSTGFHSERTGK